jgi:trimeric autotransporter adhesin
MPALSGDSANPLVPAVSAAHSTGGRGVAASSAQGIALEAAASNDTAVYAHSVGGRGVDARSAQGIALEATATGDTAVYAHADRGHGVDARSARGIALEATATGDTAVYAHSDQGHGVDARSARGIALEATATGDTAVYAHSDQGRGVDARSAQGIALEATATSDTAVFAHSDRGIGVDARTNGTGAAIIGQCTQSFITNDAVLGICNLGGNAIHGKGGTNAGLFEGTVVIQGGSLQVMPVGGVGGEISATSIFAPNKHFVIDHPCDPANRYLYHCSVESPEMTNVYSGNITTNQDGKATVSLPDYFEALNGDYRYQLTVIGQFAHAIVETEIADGRFAIKTDKPHVKVSWQVSGIRRDAFAKAHPMIVDQEKPSAERGFFLHPQAHGQPEERGIAERRRRVKEAA